jgi:protein-tyrosine kinase
MDYLQEAIEKARQQREGAIGITPTPGKRKNPDNRRGSPAPANGVRVAQNRNERPVPVPGQVDYTTTRQVKTESDLLSHNRVIAADKEDSRVEVFRQLRSQVLSSLNLNGWSKLAITGPQENVGKTLTAVNLAISISQEVNQTVMLVDLDLRSPSVSATLGLEPEKGIVDHLSHGEPLENILLNPGYPRFVIVPGLPQGQHASELLTSPEMRAFLTDITNRYQDRIIIFDLPPLLRNDDAMAFVPNTDACLLVVEDGATSAEDIRRSLQLLNNSELLGTVLNKAR